MAHPYKEGVTGHNEKLRRMTRHYGEADKSANIKAPVNRQKTEGPEDWVGFGADSDKASARGDRGRRTSSANPVATYRKGGAVKPVEVATRARGGRMGKHHGKGSTHVNVIVAPHPPGAGAGAPPPNPQLAALAGGMKPPMGGPPMGLPPGGPGGPPPGMGAPGAPPMMPPQGNPMMRAKGGRANHPDAAQDKALIKQTLKEEHLIKRARGGGVHLTGGAASGIGRLEKMVSWEKHGNKKKQVI